MCSTLRTIHSMYRRFCQDQNEIHAIGNKRRHCDLDMPSSGCTRFKNEHTTARASRTVFFVDNDWKFARNNAESFDAWFSTVRNKRVTMSKEWYDPFFSKINWRQLENWLDLFFSISTQARFIIGCRSLPSVILRILLRYWLTHTNIWHDLCTFLSPLLSLSSF